MKNIFFFFFFNFDSLCLDSINKGYKNIVFVFAKRLYNKSRKNHFIPNWKWIISNSRLDKKNLGSFFIITLITFLFSKLSSYTECENNSLISKNYLDN